MLFGEDCSKWTSRPRNSLDWWECSHGFLRDVETTAITCENGGRDKEDSFKDACKGEKSNLKNDVNNLSNLTAFIGTFVGDRYCRGVLKDFGRREIWAGSFVNETLSETATADGESGESQIGVGAGGNIVKSGGPLSDGLWLGLGGNRLAGGKDGISKENVLSRLKIRAVRNGCWVAGDGVEDGVKTNRQQQSTGDYWKKFLPVEGRNRIWREIDRYFNLDVIDNNFLPVTTDIIQHSTKDDPNIATEKNRDFTRKLILFMFLLTVLGVCAHQMAMGEKLN